MDIFRIWNNESQLHSLTGLTKNEAEEILPEFEIEMNHLGHLNSATPGRPAKHDVKGILIMMMMFYRHYITLEGLAAIFDLNNSNVKRWIESAQLAIKTVLEKKSLSHLIAPDQKKKSPEHLSDIGKSISMALNSR
jgi:hypothetical protein